LRVSFNNRPNPFYQALKEKVDKYFKENNLKPTGTNDTYLKGIFQVFTLITFYLILVFFTPSYNIVSILICCLLGVNMAAIGFNVMHEGGHQSFSDIKWINTLSAYSLNVLGGNTHFWKVKHNINHHTYTNIEGLDSDIDIKPWMRTNNEQPLHWFHKYQHRYWFFLYGISYFMWIFWDDFTKYFTGKIVPNSQKSLDFSEHIIFWFTKIAYVVIYVVIPVMMLGVAKALIGFAIVCFACGLTIASVFQLAHLVEGASFPVPNHDDKIDKEWAIHQIDTTANFGIDSKFLHWLLGGLNFQIEHHLFPKINHAHYPAISHLVRETCIEFKLQYNLYPSAYSAFMSHMNHIKKLGNE
jgi:linoleoyl-CoA desaturase